MEKRRIGVLEVSAIGVGCMGFSHGYGPAPEEAYSINAIKSAYEAGCTFFDTAEGYGREQFYPGHNEQVVGKAVRDFRQSVVLATKLFVQTEEIAPQGLDAAIRRHLKQSMDNLGTDYVDLYYLHRLNEDIPVEEVAAVMGGLIQDGSIRAWGLSQVGVDTLRAAHEVTPVSAVQNLYSILERSCEEEIFPYTLRHNIGVVPFSPIASGFLSGKVTADTPFAQVDDVRNWVPQMTRENRLGNQPILDIITEFAGRKQATNAQISLAWMLHKYPNCVPIPGSKNKERILENLGAAAVKLTDTEFDALEKALNAQTVHGHRGHVESDRSGIRNRRQQR